MPCRPCSFVNNVGYICVIEIGDLIKPSYVTEQFPKLLEDNLEVSMSLGKGKVGEKMSEVPKMQRAN